MLGAIRAIPARFVALVSYSSYSYVIFLYSSAPPFEWLRFRLLGQPDRVNPFLPTLLGWEDMERLLARLVPWRAEPHKKAQSNGVHHA
jgi:hypothetical protein